MNKFKRFFALILTLCMVLSYVPFSASATGSGTAATPPAGISGANEPFPLTLMTQHGNRGGHFRIPAIVTLNDGTLVAAADARWQGWDSQDDNGNIDTVVSYSKDNGATWEVSFANYFTCSTPYAENWGSPTVIDPGIVTDGEKVYMIADLFPGQSNGAGNCTGNAQAAVGYDDHGRMLLRANAGTNDAGYYLEGGKIFANDGTEQAGYTVDAYFNLYQNGTYVRNLFEYSTDSFMPIMTPHLYMTVGEFNAAGELNWSEPTMLNPALRSASERYYLVSPGRGIKTKDNVLVIGGYGNASGGEKASIIFFDGEAWHRSSTEASSVSSESELVELSDGTLRMFVRHSGNGSYVQYIDWTPVYTDGKVTDYTPSAAVNTTAVAHNNTNVTAIGYSETIGGKQVIMVSCPTDTSGAWERYNGKIFTFVVDPTTKAMTLINSYEVNGVREAYSYSCLTELADGTVGLLYEKGDGGNITYAEFDPEVIAGAEFDGTYDGFAMGSSNLQGEIRVKKAAGVTHIHVQPNANVAGVAGDYVAYDVTLCKDAEDGCTGTSSNVHTGEAKVTVPISAEMAAKELKGFVVNSDGSLDYVNTVSVSNVDGVYLATFKAPHFSTVGVMPKTNEEQATSEKNVTVKEGGTYVDTLTGVDLNGNNAGHASAVNANVTWSSVVAEAVPTAQLGSNSNFDGETIDLNDCLYTFTKNADDTWVVSAEVGGNTVYINPHAGASNAGKPNREYATNITLLAGTNGSIQFKRGTDDDNGDVGYLHFWDTDANKRYWDQCTGNSCSGHDLLIYKVADTTNSTTLLGGYYTQVTNISDLVSGNKYLIVAKDNTATPTYYVMHPTTAGNSDKFAHVAKVTGDIVTSYKTTVIIEGVAEGTTAIAVGETLYNITVSGLLKQESVTLDVGGTTTITDNTGNYRNNVDEFNLDEDIARVTVNGTTVHNYTAGDAVTPGSTIADGQYLLVNLRRNSLAANVIESDKLDQFARTGVISASTVWTIKASGDGYTIQDANGKYMTIGGATADLSDSPVVLTLSTSTYTSNNTTVDSWQIGQGSQLLNDHGGNNFGGYGTNGDEGSQWSIIKVTDTGAATTTITFAGVSEGTTSVVVGDTRYNINVAYKKVDIELDVNESTTIDDNTGNYQDTYKGQGLDTSVATVTVNGTTVDHDKALSAAITNASQFDGTKQYIIVCNRPAGIGGNAADESHAVLSNEGSDNGLVMNGPLSVDSAELWTITAENGGYVVKQGDQYLTFGHTTAGVTSTKTYLTMDHSIGTGYKTGWRFSISNSYLSDYQGTGKTTAHGWNDAGDEGNYWTIYEVTPAYTTGTTSIEIEGVSYGTTSVVVGDTHYTITVGDDLPEVKVDLRVGDTTTINDNTGNYANAVDKSNLNETIATVTVTGSTVAGTQSLSNAVTAIESGKTYVFYNKVAHKLMNNTWADASVGGGGTNGLALSSAKDNFQAADIWTVTAANGGYYIQDANDKYLTVARGSAGLSDTPVVASLTYDGTDWTIGVNGEYLNDFGGAHSVVAGWSDINDGNSQWEIYEVVTSADTHSTTTITIIGAAAGETSVVVGGTRYKITVKERDPETVDVVLKVGETKPFYIEHAAYTDANVTTAPNAGIAGMTVFGHLPQERLSLTEEIKSGREYLVVVNNRTAGNNATNNTLTYSAHINNTNYLTIYNNYTEATTYWIIEKAPGDANKYYFKTPYGSYLALASGKAYTTDTPTALDLSYNAAGYWTISATVNGTAYYLGQYDGATADYAAGRNSVDTNSYWEIYERTENAHTQVVFTGNAVGTTTAKVGHVTYNITVAADTRDVEIFVGETWNDVLDGIGSTGSNAGQAGADIADVSWTSGTRYSAEAKRLNTAGTVNGSVSLADSEVTFTNTNGKFYINAASNVYVNIDGYPAGTTRTAITVTFEADGSARLSTNAGHYLRVYTYDDGAYEWHYKAGSQYSSTDESFKFYIYAPVTDQAESSSEIPGYKRLTAVDQIVSGEGYLIAFVRDGNYYVYSYENTSTGKYNNMARIDTVESGTVTNVTVVGMAPGNTKVEVQGVLYNITVKPYQHNFAVEIGGKASFEPATQVTDADIEEFNAANGTIVTVALVNGKLVFTGVAEGTVDAYLLGGCTYVIKVTRDVVDGDESKYVGGQAGTQGQGQVITGLIVSNDTDYDLNMAADVQGDIRWESSDESVFTIDQNGTVHSGSNAGEAYVNVYVNNSLYQTIPVVVLETVKQTGNNREVDVYNTEVTNCTAYYTYNKENIAIFPEGYQFYVIHSKTETDIVTFFATPNQGYALTFVNGVNGTWYHTVTDPDGTGYLTDSGTHSDTAKMGQGQATNGGYYTLHDQLIAYVVNNSGSYAADLTTVHNMLDQAVLMEVDGAFFYSRGTGTGDINDSTRFVADKLPEVDKSVNGILGISGLQADWVIYEPGMYAEIGEIVYFTIRVEQEAPTVFKKNGSTIVTDAYGQVAALEYKPGASLVDNMKDAYFYTKDLDMDDDIDGDGIFYEGVLQPSEQMTVQDVTDVLNRGWTQKELEAGKRVHEYYVVYPIKASDLNKQITNTVELGFSYGSYYSNGSRDLAGNAEAALLVLGQSLGDVLVDFGLPVVLEGLTAQQLPGVTADNLDTVVANTNKAQGGCNFGSVAIVQTAGANTPETDTDDLWSLTYTPNKVMTTYDVIYVMDANDQLINYIRVRPATTVYYEESFAEFGTANPDKDGLAAAIGWTGHESPVTGTQQYQYADCTDDHEHNNFGFDGKYAAETGKSNGTEAVSTLSGDTATFTFNGTGFEVYANCDPDTSIMTVMLYRQTFGQYGVELNLTKFFQVITKTHNPDYTGNEITDITADSLPVVSVNGLKYGTYKVVIRHTKKMDDTTSKIRFDGFRVFNTIEQGDQYYPQDEWSPVFTELRDEVLYTAQVDSDSSQTYNENTNHVAEGATVAFLRDQQTAQPAGETMTADAVQDWLENGPKNEIWMVPGDTLAFKLSTGDPTTQGGAVVFAQLGLKAPSGSVTCKITMLDPNGNVITWRDAEGNTVKAEKEYTITSATDMFYDLPDVGDYSLAGLTVSISVSNGMLSVTKLKATVSNGVATGSILGEMDDLQVASVLDLIYGRNNGLDDDIVKSDVTRIYGDNRFETAFKVADELKRVLKVQKFDAIIIASGTNFADALSGSYLASVKNAPILLSYDETYDQMVRDYIAKNLAENGTVYILGGNAAVSETMDAALAASGVTVKRLAGADRFETNLAILAEAGVNNQEILVCTGTNFADSLSASATGKPIMLVYNESGKLTDGQAEFLAQLNGCTFTVIGGEKAVSAELENAVAAYGAAKRLSGENRFETSVLVAETYFNAPKAVVLAYAGNYPDGLCGGVLANAMGAPLVLTMTGYDMTAAEYVKNIDVKTGIVLGGEGLISNGTVVNIYSLTNELEIIVK